MFIKKLKLTNFKNFKNIEVDFSENSKNRHRTIILGQNGVGKSNILKSLALVTAGSNALGELIGNPDEWIRYGHQKCRIDLEISTQRGGKREIWLEIRKGDTLSSIIKRSDSSLEEIDSALHHTERNYFMAAYGASRRMPSGKRRRSSNSYFDSPRAECVASLFDKDATLNSIEEWALDMDYSKSLELDLIKKIFDDFLPGISFHSIDRKKRKVLLKTQDGIVPIETLSDGYLNMASWIGDLLYRITNTFSDYKNPILAKGVLILDEIDSHLHPVWQRRLLSFIQETLPNMQLIATTHSPFTAQQAGANELIILKREAKEIIQNHYSGNPQELLLHQLIMSDVFGLESDESMMVQDLKEGLDEILLKKRKSAGDKKKLIEIENKLKDIPNISYSNSLITNKEREAMIEILKSYKK